MARIVWDLDGTVVGLFRGRNGNRLALRPGILNVLRLERKKGNTLILWTFGNREWWRHVRSTFPPLGKLFHEVYTRDELPGRVTNGRGFPEPIKDIRIVRGDVLVDNDSAHHEWACRHGLGKKYVLVPTFGM